MSSLVDLRKFRYQLAPVLKVAGWRLDALNMELGKVRRAHDQCVDELKKIELDFESFSQQLKNDLEHNFELSKHRNGVLFLQMQKERIQLKKSELSAKRVELDKALAECIRQQQRLDLLDSHRQSSLDKFVLEETNLLSSEADREWSAKMVFKKIQKEAQR